jgi:hypothetical protein
MPDEERKRGSLRIMCNLERIAYSLLILVYFSDKQSVSKYSPLKEQFAMPLPTFYISAD